MAFRKSPRGRSSFSRRRFGSRVRLHTPKDSGRWEQGKFFLNAEREPDDSAQDENLLFHLASVRFSVGGDLGADGRAKSLTAMTRYMEVGGMVFDWGIQPCQNRSYDAFGASGDPEVWFETAVITDRLAADGIPSSTEFQQLATQSPVTLGNFDSPTNIENNYPTRIHWRRTEYMSMMGVFVVGDSPAEGTIRDLSFRNTFVRDQRRTENLRLKLRLEDDQGLFLRSTFRTSSAWPDLTPFTFRFWAAGTIFYRIRF